MFYIEKTRLMYYNMIGILAFHVCESSSVYLVKALKCDRSAKWCRNGVVGQIKTPRTLIK